MINNKVDFHLRGLINPNYISLTLGSVYFAVNNIIASRSTLPQLHNPMSHEYYILFYSTVLMNPIVNPRSHKSEAI